MCELEKYIWNTKRRNPGFKERPCGKECFDGKRCPLIPEENPINDLEDQIQELMLKRIENIAEEMKRWQLQIPTPTEKFILRLETTMEIIDGLKVIKGPKSPYHK